MLRRTLIAVLGIFVLVDAVQAYLGRVPPDMWVYYLGAMSTLWLPTICLIILLLCLVFECILYKTEALAPPGPDWVATEELTVDGKGIVRVWYHPRSGERAYVREGGLYLHQRGLH